MDQDLTVILHGKPNEVSSSLFHMNRHVFDVNLWMDKVDAVTPHDNTKQNSWLGDMYCILLPLRAS